MAASEMGERCEIVVFPKEQNFAYRIATSDGVGMIQPRTLEMCEQMAIGSATTQLTPKALAHPLTFEKQVVGSITVMCNEQSANIEFLESLGRMMLYVISKTLEDTVRSPDKIEFEANLIDSIRDGIILLDDSLTITWANEPMGTLLGIASSSMIGKNCLDYIHPDDVDNVVESSIRFMQGLESYRLLMRVRKAHGDYSQFELTGMDHRLNPKIGGLLMSLRDAEHTIELKQSLGRADATSKAIVAGLKEGIISVDQFGSVTLVNNVARQMFDIAQDVPPPALTLENFQLVDESGTELHVMGNPEASPNSEYTINSLIGPVVHVTRFIEEIQNPDNEGSLGSIAVLYDITETRAAEAELRRHALHDQLTGLPNRRQLDQLLAKLTAAGNEGDDYLVAACFIDLDGFKLVNDNHGHKVGDEVIRIAANRLSTQLRSGDLLVRQGGDEFVAMLTRLHQSEEAMVVAERCREALGEPYYLNGARFDLSASIGVAVESTTNLRRNLLLQQADMALYAAKDLGRNRIERFDSHLAKARADQEQQRRLLRDALDSDSVCVHLQPIVSLEDESITGFEALARIHTSGGVIAGPASFLGAVANTGMAWDLDRATFKKSCEASAQLARIDSENTPIVACNFDPVSLCHHDFIEFVIATLRITGAKASQMAIEVTETGAMEASGTVKTVLEKLNHLGFTIALDDFGTGYSSLAHLRDLPISSVKVDRSFIVTLNESHEERAITEAVVRLAEQLELDITAEGVEDAAQAKQVKSLGFPTAQGWHFWPALKVEEAIALWQDNLSSADPTSPHLD